MSQLGVSDRLVQHLATTALTRRCELTADDGMRRCEEDAVAIRWEDGFADSVCEHHAATAIARGAIIVRPRRHAGLEDDSDRSGKELRRLIKRGDALAALIEEPLATEEETAVAVEHWRRAVAAIGGRS